ncbi:MAG: AAA family ATPase [Nitrososphaeraceae archaeon]
MQTRSTALMNLGFMFAELNLQNEEILAMLMNADERWGKFVGRSDRMKRLMEIVTIARQKHPFKAGDDLQVQPTLMGWRTLLSTTVEIEWAWEGWLQKGGYMLLTGPQGIGKTQLSFYVGSHLALGKDCLGRKVPEPRKIMFLSLEMGLVDLKVFLRLQNDGFSSEELDLLESNLLIFPHGEPLYLSDPAVQSELETAIGDLKLDGVIIDSMGSAAGGDSAKAEVALPLMDWQDRMRQRTGTFMWFVHHHRKGTADNRKPNKLDDVYGHYSLTARATSVFAMWPSTISQPNIIEMLPLKVRLSARPDKFHVVRDSNLHFKLISSTAVDMAKSPTDIQIVDEPENQPLNGGEVRFQI